MATEQPVLRETHEAAEDLSSDKYRFVVLDSGKVRRPDSAVEVPYGILQNAPAAGGEADVMKIGRSKLVAGEALAEGDFVKPEYISASDAGKGIKAAGELQCVRARVVEAATAEDELASVDLLDPSPARQSVSVPLPALTANNAVVVGLLPVDRAIRITKIAIACTTIPVDADGTCLLAISNHDKSGSADDNLLGAATFDLEGISAAKETEALTLTATAADLILAAGDFVFATLTSDSAAIDTNMAGASLVIEFDIL